jgi:hypothetical protein
MIGRQQNIDLIKRKIRDIVWFYNRPVPESGSSAAKKILVMARENGFNISLSGEQ